jgi:hypothetical protein
MISPQQAADIRTRNMALTAWVDSIRGKNGWASYRPEDKPAGVPDVTNEEQSSLELFEFVTNPPEKYFLYVNEQQRMATTWTGEKLGEVRFGREYKDNWGRKRVPVTVYSVNGYVYSGTYYRSAGDYARVKASKTQRPSNLDSKIQHLHSLSSLPDEQIQHEWSAFSKQLQTYFEHYFPIECAKIAKAIQRLAQPDDERSEPDAHS